MACLDQIVELLPLKADCDLIGWWFSFDILYIGHSGTRYFLFQLKEFYTLNIDIEKCILNFLKLGRNYDNKFVDSVNGLIIIDKAKEY